MGVIALATQVIIPKWFITKRGRAVALGQLGGRLGNAVTPLYVQYLVARGSWRVATAVCGIVVWSISLLPSALFLRRRPEDMGLKPDGVPLSTEFLASEKEPETFNSEISFSVREAIRFSSFYLLVTAIALSSFSTPALHLHMIPYMTDRGISDAAAVSVVALSSVSGALGSLTFGLLAERYTARLMMVLGFALLSSSFILLLFVNSTILALIWGIHLGIAQGGSFTLQQVIFADYYGRDSLGAIRGIVWPIQMIFNSIGPLAAALAYDTTGDYRLIFFVFAILAIVSSAFLFLARPPVTTQLTRPV